MIFILASERPLGEWGMREWAIIFIVQYGIDRDWYSVKDFDIRVLVSQSIHVAATLCWLSYCLTQLSPSYRPDTS